MMCSCVNQCFYSPSSNFSQDVVIVVKILSDSRRFEPVHITVGGRPPMDVPTPVRHSMHFNTASMSYKIQYDSSFKSQMMTAVADKFGIDMRYSAIYHAQSHGGIERAQRTLEDMLRKFVTEWPKDWDKNVEFLQYAYNSAKHFSTGFSPFELVYRTKISTPLALQQQSWENNDFVERTLKKPVAKYMHDLSLKSQTMQNAAHENMTNAGQRMKRKL